MRSLPLLLVLVGCDAADTLPTDAAPPPLVLTATPFDPGTTVQLTLAGADPGADVVIGYSLTGASGGPCPPSLGGACLDLELPAQILRRQTASAAGEVTVSLPLPIDPPLDRAWFQAVQLGAPAAVSNVLDGTVRIDRDGDGLFDADERDLGTDPLVADSDGGGADDGDEVDAQTDPLVPGDDVLVGLDTVDVTLDLDIAFSGAFADLACLFGNVCDCTATYTGSGTVTAIEGTRITFAGTWTQSATTCSADVGLEDRVWEDASGQAFHTFQLSSDGSSLSSWLTHRDADDTVATATPFADGQFVADPIGVAFTTPTTTFSGTVSESESGVTATTTTTGTFSFGP